MLVQDVAVVVEGVAKAARDLHTRREADEPTGEVDVGGIPSDKGSLNSPRQSSVVGCHTAVLSESPLGANDETILEALTFLLSYRQGELVPRISTTLASPAPR